ncbi:MAG: hypothetical protein IJX64_07840 [Clostridia bacterium]|nr:hypothetical protein [Clostridia bacterium]
MAKQGMKRPDYTHTKPKNDMPPVPEIQGKAKHGKAHVNEKPISSVYAVIDTDVARDNLENDLSAADLQDQ